MDKQLIILERLFNVSPTKVWKALTDKNEMKNWYFNLEEFKAEVGFKFKFTGGHDNAVQYLHLCEITEVIPNKKLSYSWCYDGYTGISFVTFELFEQNNKTLLKLTHQGIETFPIENKDFAIHNFEEGWNEIINNSLSKYLEKDNYQNSITVTSAPHEIFEAITQRIPEWWSRDFHGEAKNKEDEFTVRFGPTFKTIRITNVVADKLVEWLCIDQHIEMPPGMKPIKNPSEWVGNKIIWEISPNDTGSTLTHSHIGLTPEVECWAVCEQGWNQTLQSISQLLTTGCGKPFIQLDDEHLTKAKQYHISQDK